jgi:hypothetical protein
MTKIILIDTEIMENGMRGAKDMTEKELLDFCSRTDKDHCVVYTDMKEFEMDYNSYNLPRTDSWYLLAVEDEQKEFDAQRTLNNLREMKQGVLEEIHQQISDGKFYDLSTPMVIHFIDGDCSTKMVCTGVGNDSNGVLTFINKGDDGSDYYDVGEELMQIDTESLLAVLEAVKAEVNKVVERRGLVAQFALFIHRFGKEHPDYDDLVIETTCGQTIARLIIDQRDCDLYRILNHDGVNIEFDFCDAAGNDVVKNIRDLSLEQIGKITNALNLRYMVEFFK